VAVPKAKVTKVTHRVFERTYTKICASQGILDKLSAPPKVECRTFIDILATFYRTRRYVLLTTATDVIIGRVTAVSEHRVRVRPFNAAGEWGEEESVALEDLLDVQWASRYLRVWQKYLPELPELPE
jgi:hypothetical protein